MLQLNRPRLFPYTSSTSPDHEVTPINDLFRPHDCIPLVVYITVVQVFVFW
jgi:hypothetical protein